MNIRQGKNIHENRPMTIILKINPLNAELNPICHLLALLGGTTIVAVSKLRVKSLCCALLTKSKRQARDDITLSQQLQRISKYTAFGMWWHKVTQGKGSEGETGEWSG